jgi:3-oxoadipate enol-lactonase
MQIAHINGVDINYSDCGDKTAPVIGFSNSLGSDIRLWDNLVNHFKDQFRLIRYDKRGHGKSSITEEECSIELLADDMVSLLKHLNVEQAIICGISVGGLIAQNVASTNPDLVKALILCDTGAKIGTDDFWLERMTLVTENGLEPISGSIVERWFSEDFKLHCKDEMEQWRQMLVQTSKVGYVAVCNALKNADLTLGSSTITHPTLCIGGDEDLSTPPELVKKLSQMIAGSSFKIINGAGHLPCIEKPDILANHIHKFIKENNLV